jgi:Glycosyl transferase family 90
MRLRSLLSLIVIIAFVGYSAVQLGNIAVTNSRHASNPGKGVNHAGDAAPAVLVDKNSHPIIQLIAQGEREHEEIMKKQSKTLKEAVAEYRRRYKLPPPPNFDKWYEFAKSKNVQLIDEYDTILDSLTPFWAVKPETIRTRAREALGFDNNLIALTIRGGKNASCEGGNDWQGQATTGMMQGFVKYLPDMDLAFNTHDEPRVVVPADELAKLVNLAKTKDMAAANAVSRPKNSFSSRPLDVTPGVAGAFQGFKNTRFNKFAHQPTWTNSRLSCPVDSPARDIHDTIADNRTAYAMGELGFVYNTTAFSDVCLSPSLSERFGFFDRPNAFNVVHELFPIFSQSKMSSYQDILYPSPWYWVGKVPYDQEKDFPWEEKKDTLYWRGSTTGGFSRDGGWRRQHRQRLVGIANAYDDVQILQRSTLTSTWKPRKVKKSAFGGLFDVKFSGVGQCDPEDCEQQLKFFEMAEPAEQQDAWQWKHLLDMDGNAFSGRFYAFLKSKSLVYKMAVFREWHAEWLRPWVHYIPLSLQGDEWLETMRFMTREDEGKEVAKRIADSSKEWSTGVLRNEDLEVWFFRLLLE